MTLMILTFHEVPLAGESFSKISKNLLAHTFVQIFTAPR